MRLFPFMDSGFRDAHKVAKATKTNQIHFDFATKFRPFSGAIIGSGGSILYFRFLNGISEMNMLKNFASSEAGAVTVDWVVLTAAIVGLGLAVMAVISGGLEDVADDINDQLLTDHITNAFDS